MFIDKYKQLEGKIRHLSDRFADLERKLENTVLRRDSELPARIATLEEQVEKIDEYLLRIQAFRAIAEEHLESRNLLTVEAPPGYRVNLNRLRNWAMRIDPMSQNDPYAQRVFLTASCDIHFLEKKKREFTERIAFLRGDEAAAVITETETYRAHAAELSSQFAALAESEEVAEFAALVTHENLRYWHEHAPETYRSAQQPPQTIALGAYAAPFEFPACHRPRLKQLFGTFFDEAGGRVLLPAELPAEKEFAIAVSCTPTRARQLDRGLQNFLLNIITRNPPGTNKVYLIDAVRFSSAALGGLKQLEDTFAIERIPRNPDQKTALLEKIVAGFSDLDDLLDLHDSVAEYNEQVEPDKRLARTTLLLFGWPGAFEGQDREYVRRIITNHERYGISFVSVAFRDDDGADDGLPDFVSHSAVHIHMRPNETTIRIGGGAKQRFTWYALTEELPESFVSAVRRVKVERASIGSEYVKRYDLHDLPPYTRDYRMLELPFGVDAKDRAHSMSFERENFAAYLVGASGSGKSTLLHTLIAGVVRNYHPDNVELWLADFKQLEFKKYLRHCPPHVKYILLDESAELVCDLIDRINRKMMERQQLFGRLGKERLDQIDPRELPEPVPLIFIILDEFSIMAQVIKESQVYKLRLQNVLAKGRALGIRFLFASQTFTKGVEGLTSTAKDQIQQRIAMKGTREEIVETLALSAALKTDQVNNWMDALPPYYALVKHRTGADTPPEVKRVNVMYFPDYAPRDDMIDRINSSMTPVAQYDPGNIHTYVDKKPIFVDGNVYESFRPQLLLQHIEALRAGSADYSGEETFVTFGAPRLMERMRAAALTPETRENLLLVGRDAELSCTAAIVTSAMRSFLAQGRQVRVWAYGKSRLYKTYRRDAWGGSDFGAVRFAEGIDEVCDEIRALRQRVRERQTSRELIVLIGMDRICSDFELIDDAAPPTAERRAEERRLAREAEAIQSGAAASGEYEKAVDAWKRGLVFASGRAKRVAAAAGKSASEVAALAEAALEAYRAEHPMPQRESFLPATAPAPAAPPSEQAQPAETGAYNAAADFQYIVRQGSRLGYHFLLCLNSLADLKATTLKVDLFRHRLAFQVPVEDARALFGSRNAATLPEHICQYHDTLEGYSFRPYMHSGITWDGWEVDAAGNAINPFEVS